MTQISALQPNLPQSQPREIQKTETAGFQETLQKTLAARPGAPPAPRGAGALGEIQSAVMPTVENDSDVLVDRTGRLIDLLDAYARQLADPAKSLKQIAPLVAEIQTQAERLMAAAAETGLQQDAALQTLATRSAVAANVEVIRFQRGDYV
jgi:hypothetical protein